MAPSLEVLLNTLSMHTSPEYYTSFIGTCSFKLIIGRLRLQYAFNTQKKMPQISDTDLDKSGNPVHDGNSQHKSFWSKVECLAQLDQPVCLLVTLHISYFLENKNNTNKNVYHKLYRTCINSINIMHCVQYLKKPKTICFSLDLGRTKPCLLYQYYMPLSYKHNHISPLSLYFLLKSWFKTVT